MLPDNENYKEVITNMRHSSEFAHLYNQTYLDMAANGVYMTSLIQEYSNKLAPIQPQSTCSLFSNPHSQSSSGSYTNMFIELTREKILNMFNATQNEYDLVYVNNVTDGLKLLAENFNFNFQNEEEIKELNEDEDNGSSCFVYLNDNHTSVLGMREIVTSENVYCAFENSVNDNLDFTLIKSTNFLSKYRQRHLFVYPAQSNFNGRKYDFDLIEKVKCHPLMRNRKEWFVCLDTASYLCTSRLDLSEIQPDFLVASFYKIFGFPTGIAALLIKKSDRVKSSIARKKCQPRYFGGGTLQFALVDQDYVSIRQNEYKYHEYLENGTISYLSIIGVGLAIEKFEKLSINNSFNRIMIQIQDYLEKLTNDCVTKLEGLRHFNNLQLVEIYYRKGLKHGPIIAFNLKNSMGSYIGYTLVDKLAQEKSIHLRTGCFCNLGACKMFLNNSDDFLKNFQLHGHKCGDHIDLIDGKPTGAIRVSFGYCTIQHDIDLFLEFLAEYFIETRSTKNMDSSNNEDENTIVSKNSQQYFKISSLYLYPIKSCAAMKIQTSWPLTNHGLIYDRFWVIVDNNGIVLTQKRLPLLTHLRPSINLERNTLSLYFKSEKFVLKLGKSFDEREKKQNIILNSMSSQVGYDEGNDVSIWLTRIFGFKEPCRLMKSVLNSETFMNKAEYLLINEKSIALLRKYLMKNLEETELEKPNEHLTKTIDEILILQFRANLVVSTELNSDQSETTEFEEEIWSNIKILNKTIKFKSVENCTRCQMININQSSAILNLNNTWSDKGSEKYCSMLLKQLYKLKLNSKFGIYLSKVKDEDDDGVKPESNHTDEMSMTNLLNKNLYQNKNYEISIGDVGIAFKEAKFK